MAEITVIAGAVPVEVILLAKSEGGMEMLRVEPGETAIYQISDELMISARDLAVGEVEAEAEFERAKAEAEEAEQRRLEEEARAEAAAEAARAEAADNDQGA